MQSTIEQPSFEFLQAQMAAVIENKDIPRRFEVTPNPFHDPKYVEEIERKKEEYNKKVADMVRSKVKMNKDPPITYMIKKNNIQHQTVPSNFKITPNSQQLTPEVRKSNVERRFEQAKAERSKNIVYDQSIMVTKQVDPKELLAQLQHLDKDKMQQVMNLLQPPNQSLSVSSSIEVPEAKENYLELEEVQINHRQ